MKIVGTRKVTIFILLSALLAACAPKAPVTPTVDIVGTTAMELVVYMLTQTAGAVTPTPFPPTETTTPSITDTPLPPTEKPQIRPAALIENTGCWTGSGEAYTLISNIETNAKGRKNVTILGMGTEPGWIVIRNPYFNNPCWVKISSMDIDPNMDMSQFPPMTPGP